MNPAEHARAALVRLCRCSRTTTIAIAAQLSVLAVSFVALNPVQAISQETAAQVVTADRTSRASLATPDEIGRWIDDLGHNVFTVRQAAASQLLSAGMSAREPLLAIVDGPDPETRAAARRLVSLIDKTEFHRRLEAFAADTDGQQHLTLPGWDQYKKLVGSDPPARSLFVDMQRQEGALLSAMFGGSKRAPSDLLESRLARQVQFQNFGGNRTVPPTLGSSAALLFLGSVTEIEVTDNSAALVEALLQKPPILDALRSDNRQDAVRRLAVGWLLHCPTKNEEILRRRLNIISNVGLEEALPLALAVVGGEPPHKRVQAITRARALIAVGELGRPEHIDRLEPLLTDASTCFQVQAQLPGQPGASVQVRDVALIAMLQLTQQRPVDYGYVNARIQPPKAYLLDHSFAKQTSNAQKRSPSGDNGERLKKFLRAGKNQISGIFSRRAFYFC